MVHGEWFMVQGSSLLLRRAELGTSPKGSGEQSSEQVERFMVKGYVNLRLMIRG